MKFKKWIKDPDVIGWLIWFVLVVALAPLCIYLMYQYTYDTATAVVRWIVGLFAAAMIAGVLSLGINELILRLRRRKSAPKRKDAKKAARDRARQAR